MAHIGFKKLEAKIAKEPGVTNPGAVTAAIGRRKYGKARMARMAAAGRRNKHRHGGVARTLGRQ